MLTGGQYSPSEEDKATRLDYILLCVRAGQTLGQATKTPACYRWFIHQLTKAERAPIVRALREEHIKAEQLRRKQHKDE